MASRWKLTLNPGINCIYSNADGLLVLTGLTGTIEKVNVLIHKVARSIYVCK